MSDAVAISLITAVTSIISALVSGVAVWAAARNRKTLILLEKNTNSLKDALVKVTGEAEFAKGLKQGTDSQNEERWQDEGGR